MIPVTFLTIFRELSISQCLRSHRHRQHLWHILMLHPYTPALSWESQHWHIPRKDVRCKPGSHMGRPRKAGRLRDLGRLSLWHGKEHWGVEVRGALPASAKITFLQSLELNHKYRGGWCIPRTYHGTANTGVVLRAEWNKFVWAVIWKVDSTQRQT